MSGHRRNRPEDAIQRAICEHLNQRGPCGMVWSAVPNGGARSKIEASTRAFALELKAENGRPTVEQMQFVSDCNQAGGYACIVHGLDHALRVLERRGLLRGTVQSNSASRGISPHGAAVLEKSAIKQPKES
jgi:hypothetical protein